MRISPRFVVLTALSGLAGAMAMGCQAESNILSSTTSFESKILPAGATSAKAYEAALQEVRTRYGVARTDESQNAIEGTPQYVEGLGLSGELRLVSTPSDGRIIARVRIRSEEGVVRAEVNVSLERRDTNRVRQFQAMKTQHDVPTGTPIDSGAALSPERREVWTTISRDHEKEIELLNGIESHFTAASTTPRPAAK